MISDLKMNSKCLTQMESMCGEEMVFLELSKEGKRELDIYELILLFSSAIKLTTLLIFVFTGEIKVQKNICINAWICLFGKYSPLSVGFHETE